jgi:hypothetical protein
MGQAIWKDDTSIKNGSIVQLIHRMYSARTGRNITVLVVRGWMRKNDLVMPNPSSFAWYG